MTPWLLVDYGDVISLPYAEAVRSEVARMLELSDDELEAGYWTDRLALDAGMASVGYWSGVVGRPVDEAEARRLDLVDLGGWAGVNEEVVAVLEEGGPRRRRHLRRRQARQRGRGPGCGSPRHHVHRSRPAPHRPCLTRTEERRSPSSLAPRGTTWRWRRT